MSRKLNDFVQLISSDSTSRSDFDMGGYVTWLRRRITLLKNINTAAVIEIIRHSKCISASRDDLICHQGRQRQENGPFKFFFLLRGSVSIFINPYLAQGKLRRGSTSSIERILHAAASAARLLSTPKSASSKRTTQSRMSQPYATLTEFPETEVSDAESDISDPNEKQENDGSADSNQTPSAAPSPITFVAQNQLATSTPIGVVAQNQLATSTPIGVVAQNQLMPQESSPQSRRSRKETPRTKLGNFVVKCEKGKNFDEESLLDEGGYYNASVIVDEMTDVMVIDEDVYDKYIREHHEKEITTMSNFVDNHPFFSNLPAQSRGVLQISLKNEHFPAGSNIVRQGEAVNRLIFLVSGSAEVIMEPGKHRYQYPELWPFETSSDVYFNECEWLRESRRRVYRKKYEFAGEVSRRSHNKCNNSKRTEISVCAVQNREVVGITEIILDLPTYVSSLRCLHDCEIYTLNLRAFRRMIRRKHPEVMDMTRAYIQMKLKFHLNNSIGDSVPLVRALYNKVERLVREQSYKGVNTRSIEKLKQKEKEMLKLLEWFKLDKAPLVKDLDVEVIQMMENMKEKARVRESVRQRTKTAGGPQREFFRRGCLAAVKTDREPLSLHKLRDPVNELILRLRMEGTFVSDEKELEELLLRYSVSPVDDYTDIRTQASRVTDEEYRLLRYRRYGNRLVRNFVKMVDTRDPRHLLGAREKTIISTALFDEAISEDGDEESYEMSMLHDTESELYADLRSVPTRPTTFKSKATTDTYKSLQFDRRSVTPGTLNTRIKNFHTKYGGKESEILNLPVMKNHRDVEFDADNEPIRGGKVFVTTIPCVSCNKNVKLKNHTHIRCQMLHMLPMNKVKGYGNY